MNGELPFPFRFKDAIISLASCEFDPTMSHKQAVFEFLMVHFIEDMTEINGGHEDIAEAIEVCAQEIGVEVPVALVAKIRAQGQRLELAANVRLAEIAQKGELVRGQIVERLRELGCGEEVIRDFLARANGNITPVAPVPEMTLQSSPVAPKVDEDAEDMAKLTVALVEISNKITKEHGEEVADKLICKLLSKLGDKNLIRLSKHLKRMGALSLPNTQAPDTLNQKLQRIVDSVLTCNWLDSGS